MMLRTYTRIHHGPISQARPVHPGIELFAHLRIIWLMFFQVSEPSTDKNAIVKDQPKVCFFSESTAVLCDLTSYFCYKALDAHGTGECPR